MAEPHFSNDDDLPRTLRRERDAREREAREREAQHAAAVQPSHAPDYAMHTAIDQGYAYPPAGPSGVVNRLEIPFRHLVWFFIKAVFAAIPALILLGGLLFGAGKTLQHFMPSFRLFEIVIRPLESAPKPAIEAPAAAVPAATKAATPAKK